MLLCTWPAGALLDLPILAAQVPTRAPPSRGEVLNLSFQGDTHIPPVQTEP